MELATEVSPDALDPVEVLRQVGLAHRLNNFPSQLSGGEQQRVSIARALAKESQLLILDDSTSALDAVTDRKVREAIKEFKPRRTTILITQRIGTAMGADKILVLSQGKMEGFGTHEDLMKNSSTYRDLYVSQIGELDKAVM